MNHLKQIAARLPEYGLDAMLLTSGPGEFYAVGFHGEGTVLVTAGECLYCTDSRYIEAAEAQVTGARVVQTGRGRSCRSLVREAVEAQGLRRVGFEDGTMPVAAWRVWEEALPAELMPAQKLLDTLRAAKDPEEQACMVRAQEITDQAFAEICRFLRPGLTELEIAARLQYELLRLGGERMSFDPIVASGPNSSIPHAVPGPRRVEKGDFITLDFGCVWGGYCSDMTRTVALGEPTEEMRRVYQVVLEAQRAGLAAARAGISGRELDAAARQVIQAAGYGNCFGHSYGHSLGLEIHESPNASPGEETLLPVGAVLSAEPGVYLPGNFGVRIEDVTILTAEGCVDITKSPKELTIL